MAENINETNDNKQINTDNNSGPLLRKYNTHSESLVMLISSLIALEISQGKTANEVDLIALILLNVATQLGTISDLRILNEGIKKDLLLPLLPLF